MRLTFLLAFLTAAAIAAESPETWPPGQTEELTYEIKTRLPRETTNDNIVKIEKTDDSLPVFIIHQTLEIPAQFMKIVTREVYDGRNLELISSENTISIPEEAKEQLHVDSVVVSARRTEDTLDVVTNSYIAPSGRVIAGPDLTTNVGSILVSRYQNFDSDSSREYESVNLIKLGSEKVETFTARDSVVGIQQVSVPAGDFKCYKVLNMVSGVHGYTYYAVEENLVPVLIELIDPQSGQPSMTVTLQEYRRQ